MEVKSSGEIVKHLFLEAKERQREALGRGNVTKHSDCSIPQIIAEPTKNRDNESAVQAAEYLTQKEWYNILFCYC